MPGCSSKIGHHTYRQRDASSSVKLQWQILIVAIQVVACYATLVLRFTGRIVWSGIINHMGFLDILACICLLSSSISTTSDTLTLPHPGRASLHGKSSLRIENIRSDDQGWYECKVLMLEQQYDTFHNGSWVHLTVNGEYAILAMSHNTCCYLESGYSLQSLNVGFSHRCSKKVWFPFWDFLFYFFIFLHYSAPGHHL